LFLLDAEQKALNVCAERDQSGRFSRWFGTFRYRWSDFTGLQPIALGGASTAKRGSLFLGLNATAWLPLDGQAWELKGAGWPTKLLSEDGHLNDCGFGLIWTMTAAKDLVFLETARKLTWTWLFFGRPDTSSFPPTAGKVFEERTFRGRRSDLPEPRESGSWPISDWAWKKMIWWLLVHDSHPAFIPQEIIIITGQITRAGGKYVPTVTMSSSMLLLRRY